ncbi:MAG: cyclic nucleotide-binding domain-containing protein [Candidatus Rifleibacteriota bacterium]
MEFISIEMPDLMIIDFSDNQVDTDKLAREIRDDPWLLNSGIIGLTDSPGQLRKSEKLKGLNIIFLVHHGMLHQQFPAVLRIIRENRRILSQRFIGTDLGSQISGSFQLHNDPVEAYCFTNLICNFLYNLNRIDAAGKDALNVVLIEMLINAIEHGNCGISYDEKTKWLESGQDIFKLIQKKCEDPTIAARRVMLSYKIHSTFTTFEIEDEGEGFDWKDITRKAQNPNLMELHGRGITISKGITENLTFNSKGNALKFDFKHQESISNVTPALFKNLETIEISKGELIFRENEVSNFLYYVVRGNYEVIVNEKTVSVLTPDDIFIGEMSFLLNNRRSATVKAQTDGCLIRITKKEFVEGIREKPHYSLFLSRLLASRIERLNEHIRHIPASS